MAAQELIEKTITITLRGNEDSDIERAFEEVVRLIDDGFTSGGDANTTGSFNFTILDHATSPDSSSAAGKPVPDNRIESLDDLMVFRSSRAASPVGEQMREALQITVGKDGEMRPPVGCTVITEDGYRLTALAGGITDGDLFYSGLGRIGVSFAIHPAPIDPSCAPSPVSERLSDNTSSTNDDDDARFTAYKVYVQDQSHSGHVRNLTLAQARDDSRFPVGPQTDDSGRTFIWAYGLNDGEKIV